MTEWIQDTKTYSSHWIYSQAKKVDHIIYGVQIFLERYPEMDDG